MTQAILSRTLTVLSLLSSYYHIKTIKVLWEILMNSCILFSLEVCFTEKASSNILSSTHMSGRTFISFVSPHSTPCSALTHRLCLAGCRRRPSERDLGSSKTDVDVFIMAVTAAQGPFNTQAYLAVFNAGVVLGLGPVCQTEVRGGHQRGSSV